MKAFSYKIPENYRRIYEAAVWATRLGNTDLSFTFLNLSIDKGLSDIEHVKSNPYLSSLEDERFMYCLERIEKNDSILTCLTTVLDSVFVNDQQIRNEYMNTLFSESDSVRQKELLHKMARTDSLNLLTVGNLITKYGFWGKSLKTIPARNTMQLVLLHADLSVRGKYMDILYQAVERDELSEWQLFNFIDRGLVEKGERQRYGTQFEVIEGEVIYKELEDKEKANELRTRAGLPTLEEQAEQVKQQFSSN